MPSGVCKVQPAELLRFVPSAKSELHLQWFDAKKGIGFITNDEGKEDIFVHQVLRTEPIDGVRVRSNIFILFCSLL